jgi:L-ascorbate metabolism protein UlaG (beta-lactamase superfamily)
MKITHIYHSGFMVTMENSILLFDWYKRSLPEIPTDQKLYVFCSHAHEDHYSPQIWDLQKTFKDVTYILDEGIADAAEHPEADIIIVRPRQTYTIPADGSGPASLKVITLESTDMGVAFYIETEGKRIYHAGDLNVWFWNDEPMEDNIASEKKCREEMQYLADRIRQDHPQIADTGNGSADLTADGKKSTPRLLDAAFVPLDFRLEEHAPRCIAAFMEILGADHVFPMHYWGREEQVKEYLKDERIRPYAANICFDSEAEL